MLFCIALHMIIFPLHEPSCTHVGTWLSCTYGEQQYLAFSAIVTESFSRPAQKRDELLCMYVDQVIPPSMNPSMAAFSLSFFCVTPIFSADSPFQIA